MSDSQPRPTDLRPPEFVVTKDDPFGSDQLHREESVKSLCQVIENAAGPLVVSVEGAYGTGKSSFLQMCAAHLEGPAARTVEFNAWQQGHTGRPLIDLVAALTAELDEEGSWDSVKETAKQIGWRAAAILSKGLIARNESADASVFDDWLDIESNVSKFRTSLRAQVDALKGNLVVFVDELDRCEPTYALDLLNKARHLFDVPGVVIVFGVNRAELGHAVETLYGVECDVDGYLRRFVDLSMQLRQPTDEEWASYVSNTCLSLAEHSSSELQQASHIIRDLLILVANNCGGRLRDVEQVVRHANLALPSRRYERIWPIWVVCLLALRYVDRDSYQRFAKGLVDVWEILLTMRRHLPLGGEGRLMRLDAIVLLLPVEANVPYDQDEFVAQYTAVRPGQDDEARSAHELYLRLSPMADFSGPRTLPALYETIEIATQN